jgi:hypothetical protein
LMSSMWAARTSGRSDDVRIDSSAIAPTSRDVGPCLTQI